MARAFHIFNPLVGPMTDEPRIDINALIVGDLERKQVAKRRHFLPALLLVLVFVGGSLAVVGVRADLFAQPPWQLALQFVLWLLCFLVFPAIGLGLFFPKRSTRFSLALLAVLATIAAAAGQGLSTVSDLSHHLTGEHGLGCVWFMLAAGLIILAIGYLSGAFIQRRRPSAVYWITAGVTLASLNMVTWHCPVTGLAHVLPGHLGGAALLLLFASAVALFAHFRQRREEAQALDHGADN